ncbi:hypothetical protein [Pseudomonas viridiflava]|uniref:hypothetical protein n=1 Tax=Pseudomonas viridiflava TaxID=33069 RepID=UPI000F03353B|nr:hypothetical protein [Pseudomonas viridiflava]
MAKQPTEASEIEFAFLRGMDEEGTVVEMSIKAQPEYDGGMTNFIGAFWPSDLVMDEVMENTFAFDLSEELVKDRLVCAGFEFSQSYQKILDEEALS